MPEADFAALDAVGLNLRAVFALDQLPDALRDALRNECDAARNYSQLTPHRQRRPRDVAGDSARGRAIGRSDRRL
jgi:hypothetical protein